VARTRRGRDDELVSDDATELARAERHDLTMLLAGLGADDWARPTALPGWDVRDVAGHVISYDVIGWAGFARRVARARFRLARANDVGVALARELSPAQIVGQFRAHPRPVGLTTAFGGRLGLTDGLIHHQDIRRALDRPRVVPPERLAPALRFALWAPPLPGRRLARGLRLVATDLDVEWGQGSEVRGPAEALLMAVAGRAIAGELSGPGVPVLAARLG